MMGKHRWYVSATAFVLIVGWVGSSAAAGQEKVSAGDGQDAPATSDAGVATPTSAKAPADQKKVVHVSNYDTVTLNVKNAPLADVLRLLSIQSRRNIVPSPRVAGTVTANLYDVTFYEALGAILQQNGAGYVEKGDFIYIYTLKELKKIRAAQREVEVRVFTLDYITAKDAAAFITPLLSPDGSVVATTPVAPGFKPSVSNGGANSYAHAERLLVEDYPENLEAIAQVIDQLDVRPKQVLIEATILQADLTEKLAFGVDLALLADIEIGDLAGGPLGVVSEMINGDIADTSSGGLTSTPANVASSPGALKVGILTENVAAFVSALDTVTDTTIVANPKIMTLNRQPARVHVGKNLGYISTTTTATATTQTVEFLDTGTELTVRPFVSGDGFIRMELKPSISSGSVTVTNGFTIPTETVQELTTNVMVRDGQTVVLGGLFKEKTVISRSQVPGLGSIPIVGNLFKARSDTIKRSEVIFLITPHIVEHEAIAAAGAMAMEGVKMARLGARAQLLPWSRTKLTAAHIREALRYIELNKPQKALWEVNQALAISPSQVEAIRLKEKLTGRRVYWPERSLLDEAVDVIVHEQTGHFPRSARPILPEPRPIQPETDLEFEIQDRPTEDEPLVPSDTFVLPELHEPPDSDDERSSPPQAEQQTRSNAARPGASSAAASAEPESASGSPQAANESASRRHAAVPVSASGGAMTRRHVTMMNFLTHVFSASGSSASATGPALAASHPASGWGASAGGAHTDSSTAGLKTREDYDAITRRLLHDFGAGA